MQKLGIHDTYINVVIPFNKEVLANHNLAQKMGVKSIMELKSFAQSNEAEIKEILSKLNNLYTPMKIIDMYSFEKGFTL